MGPIASCKHKSVKYDIPSKSFRCNDCGMVIDLLNMPENELSELLKNQPYNPSYHSKPSNVSCYSPVQAPGRSNYNFSNQRSGCMVIIIVGLILSLIVCMTL